MHCHCGTNNRAPRWTFTDPCKPEVRPGAQEESASPTWLPAPAMNARDTTMDIYGGLTLDVDRHYIGSVIATTHQDMLLQCMLVGKDALFKCKILDKQLNRQLNAETDVSKS